MHIVMVWLCISTAAVNVGVYQELVMVCHDLPSFTEEIIENKGLYRLVCVVQLLLIFSEGG